MCSGGSSGDIICCLPALIKQDLAHAYSWGDMEKHRPGLPKQVWGAWAADGHQLPAPAWSASDALRATWPQVPPLGGQPAPGDRAQRRNKAISAQHGPLMGNAHSSSGPACLGCITVDFSLWPIFSFPFFSQVSLLIHIVHPKPRLSICLQGAHPATTTLVPLAVFQCLSTCTVST